MGVVIESYVSISGQEQATNDYSNAVGKFHARPIHFLSLSQSVSASHLAYLAAAPSGEQTSNQEPGQQEIDYYSYSSNNQVIDLHLECLISSFVWLLPTLCVALFMC